MQICLKSCYARDVKLGLCPPGPFPNGSPYVSFRGTFIYILNSLHISPSSQTRDIYLFPECPGPAPRPLQPFWQSHPGMGHIALDQIKLGANQKGWKKLHKWTVYLVAKSITLCSVWEGIKRCTWKVMRSHLECQVELCKEQIRLIDGEEKNVQAWEQCLCKMFPISGKIWAKFYAVLS